MRAPLAPFAIAITLAACGSNTAATPRAATVAISMYAYHPARLTVTAGSTVTFINHDSTAHTATSTSGGLDTGTVPAGHRRRITLNTPGTYNYYCQFHPFMHAQITVTK